VPIQRFRAVRGALLLSTQGGDIDAIVAAERWHRARLPGRGRRHRRAVDPARRHHRHAAAPAGRRRRPGAPRVNSAPRSPTSPTASDEIGHLSQALRDMTGALYDRIEAIESFAADVAHELKNPLTSLRSAVETLPLAKTKKSRERLLAIIQHDVRRLDRLISDISDAPASTPSWRARRTPQGRERDFERYRSRQRRLPRYARRVDPRRRR
jgi:two-component system, OmpR family, sensor histidine kinase ChvG